MGSVAVSYSNIGILQRNGCNNLIFLIISGIFWFLHFKTPW